MDNRSIRTQPPPNMIGYPQTTIFIKEDFNQALWANGYNILLEEAVACPCQGTSSDAKLTCANCLGLGWLFINPIKTKAFISSINRNTKYKDWSPEMIGTVACTFMDVNRISHMDKITLIDFTSEMSEILTIRTNNIATAKFVFCTYKVAQIKSIFLYQGDTEILLHLPSDSYSINDDNPFVVNINPAVLPLNFNGKVSIRYRHRVTYNIIDIPHDMRLTKEYDNNGTHIIEEMPIQGIARKSQYELGAVTNFAGDNVNDNSYIYTDLSSEVIFPPLGNGCPPSLRGWSAYEVAVQNGFTGTEEEWLLSLHGVNGAGAILTGEKITGRDSGNFGEFSITDDYLYVCLQTGDTLTAVWKKIVMFQSIL